MEKSLYGLLYLISVPLWALYLFIDCVDRNLLKKRKKYIILHEAVFLSLGVWVLCRSRWMSPVVITAEIILFLFYDVVRKVMGYLFRGLKFLLFPFYYVIRPKDIKKIDKTLYKEATGEDLDEWEPWEEIEEDLKIEQNELKKVNSNSLFQSDEAEVRKILMTGDISIKEALHVFGFKRLSDVTLDDLKLRYHFLAKRFHSDNAKEDECIMQGINIAHDKLMKFAKK